MVLGTMVPEGLYRPVPEVIEAVTGRRGSPATCWRMINKGGRGGKLNAKLILGKWCCRIEDFLDYVARQSAATLEARSAVTSRAAALPQIDAELTAAGILR